MEDLEITSIDGERGLRLAGELDLSTVHQLKSALAGSVTTGQMRLDLSGLTFIDSSGLHAIAECARAENGNGPVILEGVSSRVHRIFEITNLVQHPNLEIRATDGG
jgi:anti-anti-sigma factor